MQRPTEPKLSPARDCFPAGPENTPGASRWPSDPVAWLSGLDRTAKVGAKHHIIPRFLLKRWADDASRVQVYSRADGKFTSRAVGDVAVRDFYTFIAVDQTSDSTYEELLAKIEKQAAEVITWVLNPLRRHCSALTPEQRCELDLFVAFQLVRGPRSRREIEQLADYYGKTMSEGVVSDQELASCRLPL